MKERYEGIDGLKAYAIIGIALMHIQSNGKFILPGVYLQELVSQLQLPILHQEVQQSRCCSSVWQRWSIPSAVKWGGLVNPVAKFLGGICFEIYLCHMVIYRVLEKLHFVHLFGKGLLAYIFTAVAVICGSVVFSVCAKWFLNKFKSIVKERINNRRVNHV